ncbi:MAG: hypothetical protein PHO37_16930 [Kiritimatiellae bacterium]|nr:hypothetical protein [Kiritimatiellia bacterium]
MKQLAYAGWLSAKGASKDFIIFVWLREPTLHISTLMKPASRATGASALHATIDNFLERTINCFFSSRNACQLAQPVPVMVKYRSYDLENNDSDGTAFISNGLFFSNGALGIG